MLRRWMPPLRPFPTILISSRLQIASVRPKTTKADVTDDAEHEEARTWLSSFTIDSFPSSMCHVTFSRSSGPGGQNVNKVNSKATLRILTKDLLPRIPKLLHQGILDSRYYSARSESLVIQSDASRAQSSNVKDCHEKLHATLLDVGKHNVKGSTSKETHQKVQSMQKASNENRLRSKKSHANKKASRKGPPSDH